MSRTCTDRLQLEFHFFCFVTTVTVIFFLIPLSLQLLRAPARRPLLLPIDGIARGTVLSAAEVLLSLGLVVCGIPSPTGSLVTKAFGQRESAEPVSWELTISAF